MGTRYYIQYFDFTFSKAICRVFNVMVYFPSSNIKRLVILNALAVLMLGSFRGLAQAPSPFVVQGSASDFGDGCLQITPNIFSTAGIVTNFFPFDLSKNWTLNLRMNFGNVDGNGADGMVFILNEFCEPQLGIGGDIGVHPSMDPSILIEFDTWDNFAARDDIPADHINFYSNGSTNNRLDGSPPVQMSATTANIEDGNYHDVVISWTYNNPTSQTLSVTFDGSVRKTSTGDYLQGIFGGQQFQFWSVSSSTGGARNDHRICVDNPRPPICPGLDSVKLPAPNRGNNYVWTANPSVGPISGQGTDTITVSPLVTTTYSCSFVDFCGQNRTITQTVTVHPKPSVTVNNDTLCSGLATTLTATGANTYSWDTGETGPTITKSPTNDTTFTVIGTNIEGCMDTAVATVNVLYAVELDLNNDTICEGETTTLTADGSTSYTWSTGETTSSINVSPNTTTSYSVTAPGCPVQSVGTVVVNPLPIASVSSTAICNGQGPPGTLTASGAQLYVWSTGATTNTITQSPSTTTTYTVTGTSLGCTGPPATGTITVNPLPVVSVTSATICAAQGPAGTITASGANSYSWNTGDNSASITESPITTTTYTVTGTSLGCTDTETGTIFVNPLPVVSVTSTTICAAQGPAGTITASGSDTYLWNTGETTPSITDAPITTTTYTVTGTTLNCTDTQTGTIVVTPLPVVSIVTSPVCENEPSTLTASGADSYVWSNHKTSNQIVEILPATTNFSVTGTTKGCTDDANEDAVVHTYPVISTTSSTVCQGNAATLSVIGANSYVWSSGESSNTITKSPNASTTYTVIGSSNGCADTATADIGILLAPIVTVNDSTICNGEQSELTATGAPGYTWSNGAKTDAIQVSPNFTTTYTVIGDGCPNSATGTVFVNPLPTITVENDTICYGDTTTIKSSGATSYIWDNNQQGAIMMDGPKYTTNYRVEGTDNNGCKNFAFGSIYVRPQPQGEITGAGDVCKDSLGPTVYFEANNSLPPYTFIYTLNNDTTVMPSGPDSVSNTYQLSTSKAGAFQFELLKVIDGYGCEAEQTASTVVNVVNNPHALFDVSPTITDLNDNWIDLIDKSLYTDYWYWDFGDGQTTAGRNTFQHEYRDTGSYMITLRAASNNGKCKDSAYQWVFIKPIWSIYIPNTFTPGDDYNNNDFQIKGVGIIDYHIEIYHRWGHLVFESFDMNDHWNGFVDGRLSQSDAFVYVVNVKDVFHKDHTYRGVVHLVR